MGLVLLLEIGTVLAAVYAVVALLWMLARTGALGTKSIYAVPSGSENRGIMYAFFTGMLPSEKESVRKHLPTFFGGLFYHAGIFAALVYLGFTIAQVLVGPTTLMVLRLFTALGFVCGGALLIKRLILKKMRAISTPDDIAANILVDLFLGFAFLSALLSSTLPLFLAASLVLFVYLPVGKIRHCVFFFCTRTIFGKLFGRRGVLPHPPCEKLRKA